MTFLSTQPEAAPIVRLAERAVYENRFATVYDDDVQFSDGHTGRYLRIVQSGGKPGVVMLPIAGNHIGIVRVYRYPTGTWEWGLPRGLAHGGDPEHTAREELLEELGARPPELISLGRMTPDSGILAAAVHLFAAIYDHMPAAARDTTEVAAIRWVPLSELQAAVRSGEITDGFTFAALGAAACQLPAFAGRAYAG
jgi:8-oxo-dGTP pyrophosphatase MutT (NUDIX family)